MVSGTTFEQMQGWGWQLQDLVQDLQRSNENLQQFAYIASHDLQEPLRKIQSFGDMLRGQYGEQLAEGLPYLERMQSAVGRMSALIRNLLTYSRLSTEKRPFKPVALGTLIDEVLDNLEITIAQTDAVVEVDTLQ